MTEADLSKASPGREWKCAVCGGTRGRIRFAVDPRGNECGVTAQSFVPSSDAFGRTAASVAACERCGHGSLTSEPAEDAIVGAYEEASDPVSLREEDGQVATAHRALVEIERFVHPGALLDIGCWTGSFLHAARQRGWTPQGLEPSHWAAARAADRGLSVRCGVLDDVTFDGEAFRAVVACDVLEHLLDPGAAIRSIGAVLKPGGVLYITVPDSGSIVARLLGRRWWSVLPMHVQYFTRRSMRELLERNGFMIEEVRTHAKVFSASYYAERVASFVPASKRLAAAVDRSSVGSRLIAPDLRDRMAVIARRSPDTGDAASGNTTNDISRRR